MTAAEDTILLTGGEGRLGSELRSLLGGVIAPLEAEMDITRPEHISAKLAEHRPTVLVHAAAYTDVAKAENDRSACWAVNVEGTANIVRAAIDGGIFLVHISTDYVFDGRTGNYKEDDPLGPVLNYYSLTKLVAETLVRMVDKHLVIRTSFRPRQWPYPTAFTDVHTSQDYVDVIAPDIALAIRHCREIPYNSLHVATERKSIYELAKRRKADVVPASKQKAKVQFPDDISLDTSRWQQLKAQWSQQT